MILRPDRRYTARAGERFEQLVELAPDGILVHDGERVVLANASAVRLAGATTRAQVVGLPIDTILDPPHLKGIQSQLTDDNGVLAIAPPVRDTLHRLDGADLQVEIRAVAFMDQGRPSAHLVVRDITERLAAEQAARQLEERLHEAQRMELAGTLAGGVAHEVNNMLQVISGFADFLLRDKSLSQDASEDVQEIIKAANRAATVTRQLLAFSRREVNRPELLDIGVAVRDAQAVLQRLLGDNLHLKQTVGEVPPVSVDPGQLQQVIINLALNARDAMTDGGTLTITTAATNVSAGVKAADGSIIPAGRYATLEVSDTGQGMDALLQTRIFEPFFTTKPLGRGTGLGLAAVLGVLGQNHGFIRVSSEPRMGSTFTVYLPAAKGQLERSPPRRVGLGEKTSASATVLVVDDEHVVRAIAARILQHEGYRVLQALDGSDAIQVIERLGPPHLLLTDVKMAGVSGLELARRVRERWPTVPIVFMSGYSADELALQEAPISSARFLAKPFANNDLVTAVAETLARTGKRITAVRAD
ncbi:MAG TPA: response regulator [Gemmatimonadaceae bacterium]|nr:response regulator [Gemmatimonadaceae bacterium]